MRRRLAAIALALAMAGPVAARSEVLPAAPSEAEASQQVLVLLRLPPSHYRPDGRYAGGYGDRLGAASRQRIGDRLARRYRLARSSSWAMPILGLDCLVMDVPTGRSPQQVAEEIGRDPAVAWSQPMNVFRTQGGPVAHNDPLFRAQPTAQAWRLAELHALATGRNVRIAVIDSAVDRSHPDLARQVLSSQDFVTGRPATAENHGTAVAGIIAAAADNGVGIAGVAPGARILALRACWQAGADGAAACSTLSLAKALYSAVSGGANVINMSLSGPSDPLLSQLIDVALDRGVTVVATYDPKSPTGGFPASHARVVAVASQEDGAAARSGVVLAAGRDIPAPQPGGRWGLVSGGSYATAEVSGLVALARERRGSAGARAGLVTHPGGAVDACASIAAAHKPCECACAVAGR
jgi:hypothetical protein